MHWQRWRQHGDPNYQPPTAEERFWARVDKTGPGGCWLWTGTVTSKGYGSLWVDKKPRLAHRLSYKMNVGPIPDAQQLDHLCGVRYCVNPAHLEPVTGRENLMRGDTHAAANSAKTHCPQGHAYDQENTRYLPNGSRACRECGRQRWREAHPPAGTKMGRPFATECNRGHPLSGENLYVSPKGKRVCIACRTMRERSRR